MGIVRLCWERGKMNCSGGGNSKDGKTDLLKEGSKQGKAWQEVVLGR